MIAVAEFDQSGRRTGTTHRPVNDVDRPVTLGPEGQVIDRKGRRNRQVYWTKCGRRIDYGFPFVHNPSGERQCGHCFPSLAA